MFISGILEAANYAALYPVINYGLDQKSQGTILQVFDKILQIMEQDDKFLSACLLLIVITVVAVIAKFIAHYLSFKLVRDVTGNFQKQVFDKF